MERARKNDLENGMVCYILIITSRDTDAQKSKKCPKSRNMTNHTILSISVFSSLHWYCLYMHLRYSKINIFQTTRGLTTEF